MPIPLNGVGLDSAQTAPSPRKGGRKQNKSERDNDGVS